MQASSVAPETWRLRWRTATAMVLLCRARLLIAFVPLHRWRASIGFGGGASADAGQKCEARRLAVHVLRGAARLPGTTRCLAQAMALSTLLSRARSPHIVVIAARPAGWRRGEDRLHAWVEQDGERLIGDLPGPWIETLRLDGTPK
jgi:hypothetical protein